MLTVKESRFERYAERVLQDDGTLIHPSVPRHGHSTAYMAYGCRCAECKEWNKLRNRQTREAREHNVRILRALTSSTQCSCGRSSIPEASMEPVAVETVEAATPSVIPSDERRGSDDTFTAVIDRVTERWSGALDLMSRWPVPEGDERNLVPPPMIAKVREQVTTEKTLRAVNKAYFDPDWKGPAGFGPEGHRERRVSGTTEVIVGSGPNNPIIALHERDVATGAPETLNDDHLSIPKAKGGRGGSTAPTTTNDLVSALKAAGCEVEVNGSGHLKVTKDGVALTVPSTPSDWRSLRNTIALARNRGLL